jgi:hypothetical protein
MSIPNQYIVGQVIGLTDLITNPNSTPTADQPVDDGSDVVTVYAPDGTSSTPTVTHGATNSGAVVTQQYTPALTRPLRLDLERHRLNTGAVRSLLREPARREP